MGTVQHSWKKSVLWVVKRIRINLGLHSYHRRIRSKINSCVGSHKVRRFGSLSFFKQRYCASARPRSYPDFARHSPLLKHPTVIKASAPASAFSRMFVEMSRAPLKFFKHPGDRIIRPCTDIAKMYFAPLTKSDKILNFGRLPENPNSTST